jgi:hypothetical protein
MMMLDMDTCNNITRLTLTDYRDYLQSELDQWHADPKDEDNPDGYWLHPEDVVGNMQRIRRLNKVLDDFGGDLYGQRKTGELDTCPTMVEALDDLQAYFLEVGKKSAKERHKGKTK